MNKGEFVASFAAEHRILKEDALRLTDMVLGHVRRQILRGCEVKIDRMGSFLLKYKKPAVLNNNITGETAPCGPRVMIKFRTSPTMQKLINATLAKELAKDEGDVK